VDRRNHRQRRRGVERFLAEKHEAAIEAFSAADKKVSELAQQIVKARIGASIPTQTNFGKDREWGTLAREISKKARQMPLRQFRLL